MTGSTALNGKRNDILCFFICGFFEFLFDFRDFKGRFVSDLALNFFQQKGLRLLGCQPGIFLQNFNLFFLYVCYFRLVRITFPKTPIQHFFFFLKVFKFSVEIFFFLNGAFFKAGYFVPTFFQFAFSFIFIAEYFFFCFNQRFLALLFSMNFCFADYFSGLRFCGCNFGFPDFPSVKNAQVKRQIQSNCCHQADD